MALTPFCSAMMMMETRTSASAAALDCSVTNPRVTHQGALEWTSVGCRSRCRTPTQWTRSGTQLGSRLALDSVSQVQQKKAFTECLSVPDVDPRGRSPNPCRSDHRADLFVLTCTRLVRGCWSDFGTTHGHVSFHVFQAGGPSHGDVEKRYLVRFNLHGWSSCARRFPRPGAARSSSRWQLCTACEQEDGKTEPAPHKVFATSTHLTIA